MYTKFEIISIVTALFFTVFCAIGVIATHGEGNGATLGLLVFGGYAAAQLARKQAKMLKKLWAKVTRRGIQQTNGYVEPLETATDANSLYQVFMRTMECINAAEEAYFAR